PCRGRRGPPVRVAAARRALDAQAVTRASDSTRWRTDAAGSGHGKRGSAVRRLTVPCRATHTAVASATGSVLADTPAVTQSWMAWTRSANVSAPNPGTGRPSGPIGTGL